MKTTTQSDKGICVIAVFPNQGRSYKILGSHLIADCHTISQRGLHRGKFLEGESFVRKGEAGGWRKYFTQVSNHIVFLREGIPLKVQYDNGHFSLPSFVANLWTEKHCSTKL